MRYRPVFIASLLTGLVGCAEIIGIEPWDVGSTSSSDGGSASSSATGSETTSSTSSVGGSGGMASTSTASTGSTTSTGSGMVMVDCGVANDPVMVGIPSTGDVICWYLPDAKHPGGTALAIGGKVDQPTQPDVTKNPFDDAVTADPCVATAATDKVLACALGTLEAGTVFTLSPTTQPGNLQMCDNVTLTPPPAARCFGAYAHFANGVKVSGFDAETMSPPAPWSYENPATDFQKLLYTKP